MQLHQLQSKNKSRTRKRVGRGGKRGTYSGKGVKGQKSRSGRKMQPSIREMIKRYPKLRGYRQEVKPSVSTSVALGALEKNFEKGAKITPNLLIEKRLIRRINGKNPQIIKILAKGKVSKKFEIHGCLASAKAREMIEKSGGVIH